jgi:hypothetical protein
MSNVHTIVWTWIKSIVDKLHRISFILLLVFLLGIAVGSFVSYQVFEYEKWRAKTLRGMIIDKQPYDVTQRL